MSFKIELINEKIIEIKEEQTILQASLEAGIPHYHVCGGNAGCSTCRVVVQQGGEHLSYPNKAELSLRMKKKFPENVRLACQTKVMSNDVKIQRIIRDETDLDLYVYGNDSENLQTVGEEKQMALFFLDIRNFTPFIEQHLPFDVIHIIRRLNIMFNDIIVKHKGKIIEFTGDGFYAVFGFDEPIKEAVNNAYTAGKQILDSLIRLNENYITKYFDHKIDVGIGLHAGKVIVGKTGVKEYNPYTVMGFPVNVAARLESATKELNNNFIISDYAYKFLSENNSVTQKQIKLKGVSEPFCVRLMGKGYNY
ncbi:MAG: adenylate/guanylate cyclase domain-containing protein [Bacteroidetes bacterium]|nr:adenylate/guanylate cyclase domain-containing protein [Bacteroidota bacterium]